MVIPAADMVLVIHKMVKSSANPLSEAVWIHPSPLGGDAHRGEGKTGVGGAGYQRISPADVITVRPNTIEAVFSLAFFPLEIIRLFNWFVIGERKNQGKKSCGKTLWQNSIVRN
jgi:hypothetical protein